MTTEFDPSFDRVWRGEKHKADASAQGHGTGGLSRGANSALFLTALARASSMMSSAAAVNFRISPSRAKAAGRAASRSPRRQP
jgi:hypothetical protein